MGTDMDSLIREVKSNGVSVERTGGGHYKLIAPDGQPIIAGTTPGDDGHAAKQVRADLKAHGYETNGNGKDTRRHRSSRQESKNADLAIQILGHMQLHPDSVFRPSFFAVNFDRPLKDVSNALMGLKRNHPEVINPERGVWMFSRDPFREPIITTPPPTPVRKVKAWGARGKIQDWIKAHPRETFTCDQVAKALELEVPTVRQAIYVLAEVFGDELQKPKRGMWRYQPAQLDEEGRTRVQLNLIQHEMEKKDFGDLPPLFRRLAQQELERLKGRLENPRPMPAPVIPEAPPVEPVMVNVAPARPIVVQPTDLPDDCPGLFEAVTIHASGGVVMKDENSQLWIAYPVPIKFPS